MGIQNTTASNAHAYSDMSNNTILLAHKLSQWLSCQGGIMEDSWVGNKENILLLKLSKDVEKWVKTTLRVVATLSHTQATRKKECHYIYSVKPFLEKWVWYFRSITVPLLDRSILWRIFVFPGVVRLPIATQTADVPKLGHSPLLLLDGGEFISEVDWGDWDRSLWAAPKKRTSHYI